MVWAISATDKSDSSSYNGNGRGKLGADAMERVAAGVHLPSPWVFEPAKLRYIGPPT